MTYSVKDGILHSGVAPVPQKQSPNHGGRIVPSLLVMHYTASSGAAGAINWLCDSRAKASAHLVIAQDGTVTQLVPLNVKAWHAGVSAWKGRPNCNDFSIGIELVNPGFLTKTASGEYLDSGHNKVPPDGVTIAKHKYGGPERPWALYPPAQIAAAEQVARAIVEAYGIKEIVGHEDIAPGRKTDPGPAFPMASFVSRVFGRQDEVVPLPSTKPPLPAPAPISATSPLVERVAAIATWARIASAPMFGMPKQAVEGAQIVYAVFRNHGLSHERACGLVAMAEAESSFNPYITGDKGAAFSLFQHHWGSGKPGVKGRGEAILAGCGIDLRHLSQDRGEAIKQACEAALWELNGPEHRALRAMLDTNTAGDAAEALTRHWERPAAVERDVARRRAIAERWDVYFRAGEAMR